MPVFSIELPDKRVLDIEAGDQSTALRGAQEWHQSNPMKPVGQGEDIAKSAGVGVAKGGIGLLGAPADLGELGAKGIDSAVQFIGGQLGLDPKSLQRPGTQGGGARQTLTGIDLPGAARIQKGVESVTGDFYKPKTLAGEYAQTAGEFAPVMAAGPGGLARKAAQWAGSSLASETGGQAFKGTEAEPFARATGAIFGGAPFAGRGVPQAVQQQANIEKVKAAAEQGYKSPEVGTLIFKPTAVDNLANSITSQLQRAKANERLAPQTNALIDEMKKPVNGVFHSYEDLQTTRELLGKQAGNFTNPQEQRAASIALKTLTAYIDNIPQSHLVLGSGAKASETLAAARGNYASAKTAEKVAEKLANAELQAGSTYSGGNINNATRQKLRPLLTSKKQGRGLTEEELGLIEQSVVGSPTGNALRATGKLLGGGGGMQMFNTGGAGALTGALVGGGPLGAVVGATIPPALGYMAKKAGDVLTRKASDKIVNQILSRSPLAMSPNNTLSNIKNMPPWLQQAMLATLMARPQVPAQVQQGR